MVRAGSSFLSSHALLENPRVLPEDVNVVYWDAIVRCSEGDDCNAPAGVAVRLGQGEPSWWKRHFCPTVFSSTR